MKTGGQAESDVETEIRKKIKHDNRGQEET